MEEYVRKCFEDYMSGSLVHHRDDASKGQRPKRMNVKAMSPRTRQEYLKMKNREHKAKSRERQKKKLLLSSAENVIMEVEHDDEEGINFDGILGECRETLSSKGGGNGGGMEEASATYTTVHDFLETMCVKHPEFEWYMKNDPRTLQILKQLAQWGEEQD